MSDIIDKIKEAGLTGRGGAGFPVWQKWSAVRGEPCVLNDKGICKYVICNVSEGEPGVRKDAYLLEKYPEKVIAGMVLAIEAVENAEGIIYLNHNYYRRYGKKIMEIIKDKKIIIFEKPEEAGYIGGEESALLNVIEGKRAEPRLKPPFPVTSGLFGKPTIINNVETFYNACLVYEGSYKGNRFYTLGGEVKRPGVYEFGEKENIKKILEETGNMPSFPFFVQVGGDGSGTVLDEDQLETPATGAGSIKVFNKNKVKPKKIIFDWLNFFASESCGQCTACREGTYRLREIIDAKNPNWKMFKDLLDNLADTSFCGLGAVVPTPIYSYIKNVLKKDLDNFQGL